MKTRSLFPELLRKKLVRKERRRKVHGVCALVAFDRGLSLLSISGRLHVRTRQRGLRPNRPILPACFFNKPYDRKMLLTSACDAQKMIASSASITVLIRAR
ncbi:hypothetical protein K505DRAFT_151395 [Melanomma pulvis-pyrius CBS 109.77]|uniref:Uncharacterized protein n=1 Tax=Melanomma pulvis-pyrius CBS 109.77 TaxID=1314802 RepID=A0A6A6XNB4_9PLEO|nr:hypothetical protein K505DRAFT_151395 [Melanomma pulvis-pyrius CBS 109.77]